MEDSTLSRTVTAMFIASLSLAGPGVAAGQDYPTKPVRAFASEIGGSTDFAIRLISPGFSAGLGQNLIMENRPSNLLGEFMLKVPPDGYTFLVAGGTFMTVTLLQKMLSASLYNLFDRHYADPVAFDPAVPTRDVVQQNGRTFRLKLESLF